MKMPDLLLALVLAIGAAGPARAGADILAPGVLLDLDAGRAVVADAAGFAQAVSLADGRSLWTSSEPAYPLLEAPGRLLALGRIEAQGVGLLLLLDPASGSVLDRIAFDVPEHVAASVMPRPKASFSVQAQATPLGARVFWREVAAPLRGAAYGDGSDEPRITEGAFDLVLDAQRSLAIPLREVVAPPVGPRPDLASGEQLPGLGGRQFRAFGNAGAMESAPETDPALGIRWRWTVMARGAERAVAGPALPYAYLPFALHEATLLYRTEPAAWIGSDGSPVGHGALLVAWDLASGRERWRQEVLDTVYRGPLPP